MRQSHQSRIADLARTRDARAVAWLSTRPEGVILRVYNAQRDRTVSRTLLARPPFDNASAAAIALSLKSLLRHSERMRRSDTPVASPPEETDERQYFPARLGLSLGAGARTPAAGRIQPSLDLAVIWALDHKPLAFGARVSRGQSQNLHVTTKTRGLFAGEVAPDYEFGLDVRWVPLHRERTRFEILTGSFLGRRQVSGNFPNSERITASHTSFGLVLGTRAHLRLFGRVYGEVGIDARYTHWRLAMQGEGEPLYAEPMWAVQAGLGLRVHLPGLANGS